MSCASKFRNVGADGESSAPRTSYAHSLLLPRALDIVLQKRKPRIVRKWSKDEDSRMSALVGIHGTRHWGLIASKLGNRTGKQCRERWHNQLDPSIRKDAWTKDEEEKLMLLHAKFGNKWAEVRSRLESS